MHIFLFCMYKMVKISAETFAKNCIPTIKQLRKGKEPVLWIRIKDIGKKLDVKNIGDLVYKEIKADLKLTILQNNKLKSMKDMDQNLFKALNLCMLMNAL